MRTLWPLLAVTFGGIAAAFGCGDSTSNVLKKPLNAAEIEAGAPVVDAAAPAPTSPFDYDVFTTRIQSILDDTEGKGCTAVGCHGSGAAGLTLVRNAAKGSAESTANFGAVIALSDLTAPDTSQILARGTEPRHGGGGSVVFTADDKAAILDWIQKAKASGGHGDTKPGCTPSSSFNAGVFRSEILPILMGDIDLNNPGQPASTGCGKSPCHGQDRPHALVLERTLSAEQNLANFACQVDLKSPTSSAILACPLNDPRCVKPHPGGPVWSGSDDHNYQRILSWLFAAKSASNPIDFAYFVRNVEPMFDDTTLLASPNSCASTQGCHGVNSVAELPPNRSNFPILQSPATKASHEANFNAALNFLNFLAPEGSGLYLFPTNEIAKPVARGSYSLGLAHGGGQVIATDSVQARAILKWARGLRLDAAGIEANWIVAGDYPNLVTVSDPTAIDEKAVLPRIFDPAAGAQTGDGTWDQLSAGDTGRVDLGARFTRAGSTNTVYAAAYLVNTTSNDKVVRIQVISNNSVLVLAGNAQIAISNGSGADALGTATLKPRTSTRFLVKVMRAAADTTFGFTAKVTGDSGQVFADDGQVLVKLDPDGGI